MPEAKRPPPSRRRKPTRPTPKPKPVVRSKDVQKVSPEQIALVPHQGGKGKGDGPQGEYWEIQLDGKRVGEVFVNIITEEPVGLHASLQIFLNRSDQGLGIGRIAYRLAADASQHDPIYLHMRKNNLPSRIAAEAAGFRDVSPPGFTQLILKRERHQQ